MGKIKFNTSKKRKKNKERQRTYRMARMQTANSHSRVKHEHVKHFSGGVFYIPRAHEENLIVSQPRVVLHKLDSRITTMQTTFHSGVENEHSMHFSDGAYYIPGPQEENIIVSQPRVILHKLDCSCYQGHFRSEIGQAQVQHLPDNQCFIEVRPKMVSQSEVENGKRSQTLVPKLKRLRQCRRQTPLSSASDHGSSKTQTFQRVRYQERKHFWRKRSFIRYHTDTLYRQKLRQYSISCYKTSIQRKTNIRRQSTRKYRECPKHRDNVKTQSVRKYRECPKHRDNVKTQSVRKYRECSEHRENVKQRSIQKYQTRNEHRDNVKQQSIKKYRSSIEHRENVRQRSVQKYQSNIEHRENVIRQNIQKYQSNIEYRENVRQRSVQKYHEDSSHQTSMKLRSTNKYRDDEFFRENVQRVARERYNEDQTYREQRNMPKRQRSYTRKNKSTVLDVFTRETELGPEFICSCCYKILFHNQVIECSHDRYDSVQEVADLCISDVYVHTCSDVCTMNCEIRKSPRGTRWVCHTCDRKIKKGNVPSESHTNNLELQPIPTELNTLNTLEQQLIALRLSFAKMVLLPKGGQHGVHGAVVSVPSNIQGTLESLPRNDSTEALIRVKLKRKLSFKGHAGYQFVNTSKLHDALLYLKNHNPNYGDVAIDLDTFENPVPEVDSGDDEEDDDDGDDMIASIDEDIFSTSVQEEGLQLGTCLQPVDIGQDVLDFQSDICCVAPGEGNLPVKILQEKNNEAMTFPTLFPDGTGTYNEERETRLTLHRYFVNRMFHADSRFARNISYIFHAQYLNELQAVISSVSVALRKGKGIEETGSTLTASQLRDRDTLRKLIQTDKAYRFLKPVRGTPSYWQSVLKDLIAAIAQLGKPTWFLTFSSAEFRWPEIINAILRQVGDNRKYSDLTGSEKADVLKLNPVTSTRMFDRRLQTILKSVIKGPTKPIGEVVDYFYRIEFHLRGAPHVHMLLWIKDAPQLNIDSDEEIVDFIDQHISCNLPDDTNSSLYEQVSSVQMHSQNHTKSCKIKNTVCRFNFPKPPSLRTFISRPADCIEDLPVLDHTETTQTAKNMLKSIVDSMLSTENTTNSLTDIYDSLGITQNDFEEACNVLTKQTAIVLKRDVSSTWVNNYNPILLSCFDSNMDIQYITDIYACISYVVKYISKSESQMGHVLQAADSEAREGNLDALQSMKKIGGIYLSHKEVSAQEAIYRLCELNLKEFSRKVQFVPVGSNPVRFCKPLSVLQQCNDDDDDVWLPSIIDKYKCRPRQHPFLDMCLGTFCSQYRVLASSEKTTGKNVFQLRENKGFIAKRTRSDDAILRYPKFSQEGNPEEHYLSMMQLFLPYWDDHDLKPDGFQSFQQFYCGGEILINSERRPVHQVVEQNRQRFQTTGFSSGDLEEMMDRVTDNEDVWASLFPGQEQDRIECQLERPHIEEEEVERVDLSELMETSTVTEHVGGVEVSSSKLSNREAYTLLQSLNEKQRQIFYTIRNHFIHTVNGSNLDPFHMFQTGPGGCGKSHLIKCLLFEVDRILAPTMLSPDDISVTLVAPTGVSAFNIGARTVHNGLSIPIKLPMPYQPLGEQKVNSLRAKYGRLQMLIIDEVSLVNKKLLYYVHKRLQQIKQSLELFGRTSILAVGDFHQIPPVRGTPLYKRGKVEYHDEWNENFKVVELNEIMRQKHGSHFAEMLKRLRVRKRGDALLSSDVNILKSCCNTVYEEQTLHVFPKNQHVNDHNGYMLNKSCSIKHTINAQDYNRNICTGRMVLVNRKVKEKTGILPNSLELGVGAKVMLIRNISVEDGLVNGARGVVRRIDMARDGENIAAICIVFDNPDVGRQTIAKQVDKSGVIIVRVEETLDGTNIRRRQFPLALSWATSIHKTQGLTLDALVVALANTFKPGQAYVALSRVKSQTGLRLLDKSFHLIYCDNEVLQYIENMPRFPLLDLNPIHANEREILISLLNVEGLLEHWNDFTQGNYLLGSSDMFCLTETWLDRNNAPHIDGFDCFGECRVSSYVENSPFKHKKGGGVAVYVKSYLQYQRLDFKIPNIEYVAVIDSKEMTLVCVVYRPPSYKLAEFMEQFEALMIEIQKIPASIHFVLGDFNQDLRTNSSIENMLKTICDDYEQLVQEPTTKSGSILDHAYVFDVLERPFHTKVFPIYFSYHEMVQIKSYRDDIDEELMTF